MPTELAVRHDLVLAIHQAFAAESITIAFPQVVVWSGQERPDRLYRGEVGEVRASYPGLDQPSAEPERRMPQWRLPGLRRPGGAPADDD